MRLEERAISPDQAGELIVGDRLPVPGDASKVGVARRDRRIREPVFCNNPEVSAATLERLKAALGAAPDEVTYLLTHASATEQEARDLARATPQRDPAQRWSVAHPYTPSTDRSQAGIHAYVRTLRERRGLSRKAIAVTLGVTLGTYADWEAADDATLPFPALLRLINAIEGTVEDLQQIALISDDPERFGQRLAEERAAAPRAHPRGLPQRRAMPGDHAADRHTVLRLLAIEGLLHYVLSLLKRALPGDVAEIERTSAHWFHLAARDDESSGIA